MKKAFTMLELILVIVIVGILSFALVNGWERNTLREAADQLVNHIRYTQHLAMQEDKFDPAATPANQPWFASNWQIWVRVFGGDLYYEVFSDQDKNTNSDATEEAIDPLSGTRLGNSIAGVGLPDNRNLRLTEKYGIINVAFSPNCAVGAGGKVAFDSLGRPHGNVSYAAAAPYAFHLNAACNIILTDNQARAVTITVQPETGYTSITAQNY